MRCFIAERYNDHEWGRSNISQYIKLISFLSAHGDIPNCQMKEYSY